MSSKTAIIEANIRKAFHCNLQLDDSLPFDFAEMNSEICRYNDLHVRKNLPLLLIKEMENSQRSSASTGDHLVYFLDGYLLARQDDRRSYKVLLDIQQKRFANYSVEEAQAILAWLEEIAYPKYRDLCPDDLDSAIKYWRDKAKGPVPAE
jgi:hypothetical protein